MSANTTRTAVNAPSRPPVVDYAIFALIARCVFSLGAAFALYGARGEVTRSLADANKDKHWSAATLHHNVDAGLRANLISTAVMIVMVLIIVKFIRDGRNWARLLYIAFAVLVTRDVFGVLGFFSYHNFLVRTLTGLVGLSSIAAIVLLVLPESNAYFRPAGASGLFNTLRMRGLGTAGQANGMRPAGTAGRPAGAGSPAAMPSDAVASDAVPSDAVPSDAVPSDAVSQTTSVPSADAVAGDRRPSPRGKSRQPGQPKRSGGR